MTVKRKGKCAAAKLTGLLRNPDKPCKRIAGADLCSDDNPSLYDFPKVGAHTNNGMDEAQLGGASLLRGKSGSSRDKTKEKAIAAAYRRSRTLRQAQPALRQRWSILGEERLATVFGTYMRGEDVFRIDLAAIVNVDEWLERHAALALAEAESDTAQIEEHLKQIAWIESQMAAYPAHSIFGIICKLMIWRRKNKGLLGSSCAEGETHRLARSAYADLIRLTGFLSIACEDDRLEGIL